MGQLFNELNKAVALALEAAPSLNRLPCRFSRCKHDICNEENIYFDYYVNLPRTSFSTDVTKTVAVTFSGQHSLEG